MRIISMPPPAGLVELPDLTAQTSELSASTDAAISVLNSDAARSAVIRAGSAPAAPAEPVAARSTSDVTNVADTPVFADESTESTRSVARLRARMWAMIAGGAAAAVGAVALLTAAF